jgi:hypothetical protein
MYPLHSIIETLPNYYAIKKNPWSQGYDKKSYDVSPTFHH